MPSKAAIAIAEKYWPRDKYGHEQTDKERKCLATLIDEGAEHLVGAACSVLDSANKENIDTLWEASKPWTKEVE